MTKAAPLIASTKWAPKLKDEGFVVVSLSRGLVYTTGSGEYSSRFMISL